MTDEERLNPPAEPRSTLSEEDMAKLKAAQKRNFIIALILGLVLIVCGFYAGRAFKGNMQEDQSQALYSVSAVANVSEV